MLKISHLNKQFGKQILFDDTNVSIFEKEKIGLIGRNGTGKTTLLKIIQNLDTTDCEIETQRAILIQSLEQNLQFTEPTLLQQVTRHLSDPHTDQWQAESILEGLGFSESDLSMPPKTFSSGFQIRIRLAESLIVDSDLLLLDEPTNYLDIVSLQWLANFLKSWNKSFILVTHNRKFMEEVVTHTIAIHRHKLRKLPGGPTKLLQQIQLEEETYEKTRRNQIKKQEKAEQFIRNFRSGARSAGLVQSRIKSLEKQEIGTALEHIPTIQFKFNYKPYHGNSLIRCEELSFSYTSEIPLIQNLSFTTLPGDKIAVIGKNGRGKSTLLNLLIGNLTPTNGIVKVNPQLKIGYFGQNSKQQLNPQNTILDEFIKVDNVTDQDARRMASLLLFRDEDIKKKIQFLSGGEQNRVCLGKTILNTNQILILDEPTNHLDLESVQALIKALQEFKGLVIFVSHDEDMINQVANKLVVFDENKQRFITESYQYFQNNIGWQNTSTNLTQTLQSTKQDFTKTNNTQELRLIRKQINSIDQKIKKLENKQQKIFDQLEVAYSNQNLNEAQKLAKTNKDLETEIQDLYTEFEQLIIQEDSIS